MSGTVTQLEDAPLQDERISNLRRFVSALAKNLNIKEVDQVNPASHELQYSLQHEVRENRVFFTLASNQACFQMLVGVILVHEKANVAPGMREKPEVPLRFSYAHTRLESQWRKRLSVMTEYLEYSDEKLIESMQLMQELFAAVPYSPESELEETGNFAKGDHKFHLTLQPAPFFVFTEFDGKKATTLVLGLNVIGTKILENAIKQFLIAEKAPCKERTVGLVADGNKALRALHDFLLKDDARFNRHIQTIEQEYLQTRHLEK